MGLREPGGDNYFIIFSLRFPPVQTEIAKNSRILSGDAISPPERRHIPKFLNTLTLSFLFGLIRRRAIYNYPVDILGANIYLYMRVPTLRLNQVLRPYLQVQRARCLAFKFGGINSVNRISRMSTAAKEAGASKVHNIAKVGFGSGTNELYDK